jgi:hypothetical protein
MMFLFIATFTLAADPASVSDPHLLLAARAEPPSYTPAYLKPIEPVQPQSTKRVIDKKFIAMSALAMGFTIADIERTQSCLGSHTCEELNPMLPHSRAGMYAVNVPLNAGLMYLSYRFKASGKKKWWIAPIAIAGSHLVGAGFRF